MGLKGCRPFLLFTTYEGCGCTRSLRSRLPGFQISLYVEHVCSKHFSALQVCLAAAAVLTSLRHVIFRLSVKVIPRSPAGALAYWLPSLLLGLSALLSLSRASSLVVNYSAPMQIYTHLPKVGCPLFQPQFLDCLVASCQAARRIFGEPVHGCMLSSITISYQVLTGG